MALTDILNKLGGKQGQQGGVATITELFNAKDLQGILRVLESHGLDQHVQSWVGNGKNMPVSGSDIKDAVDQQRLDQTAQQQGMTPDEMSEHVAQALPPLVDQATPNGTVPQQGGSVEHLMGMFKSKR